MRELVFDESGDVVRNAPRVRYALAGIRQYDECRLPHRHIGTSSGWVLHTAKRFRSHDLIAEL
jgi:hypothetical protein